MEFLQLCGTFLKGCASFFNVPVPGLDISFFALFAGLFIIKIVVEALKIIFGVDHGKDSP